MQKEIHQELEKGKLLTTSDLFCQLDKEDYLEPGIYYSEREFFLSYTSYFYLDVEEENPKECWYLCLEGYDDFFVLKSFSNPSEMNQVLDKLKSSQNVSDDLLKDLGFLSE
jgi:hypothetical protein